MIHQNAPGLMSGRGLPWTRQPPGSVYTDVEGGGVYVSIAAQEWEAGETYSVGTVVSYEGGFYRSTEINRDAQPDTHGGQWAATPESTYWSTAARDAVVAPA